jgi:hypothetical protein
VNHTILGFIIRNEWNVAISQEVTWDNLTKLRDPSDVVDSPAGIISESLINFGQTGISRAV